jgi:hypothetical protein
LPTLTQGSHHVRYVSTPQTLRLTSDARNYVLSETYFVVAAR